MALLGQRTITRRRYTGGAWTAGRWTRGTSADASLLGSVQRLTGRDRQISDTGDRTRTDLKVITQRLGFVRTEDQHTLAEADELVIDGIVYTVSHVDVQHPLIPHNVIFGVRNDETSASTPAGVENDIVTAFRTWFVAMGANGGIPSADAAVIFADENGPRPPLPYVVIDLDFYDERVGYDEVQVGSTALIATEGERRGTLTIDGFGRGAEVWMERAVFMLNTPASIALLTALNVEPLDGVLNVSDTLDTDTEIRFTRQFEFTYRRLATATDTEQGTELAQVVHTDTLDGRVVVVTEDL